MINSTTSRSRTIFLSATIIASILSRSTPFTTPLSQVRKTTQPGAQHAIPVINDETGVNEFITRERELTLDTTRLGMVVDERREFEMNLGKAMDTLKKDYPDMLTEDPDFEIYNDDIDMADPMGFTLHGLKNYRTFFQLLHSFVSLFYCPESSGLQFRMVFDWARSSIRVSFNAVLIPKLGGVQNKVYLDGISSYEVDRGTGMIVKHTIDKLLLNEKPLLAPKGIFHYVSNDLIPVQSGIPSGPIYSTPPKKGSRQTTHLQMASSSSDAGSDFDMASFEKKNDTRRKYGLAPLTPDEFNKIEAEVQKLAARTRKTAELAAAELSRKELAKREKVNVFGKMFSGLRKDECESNYDCERPQVCCDFIVKKMCCASGQRVSEPQMRMIPVPAAVKNYPDRPGSM